MKKGDGFNIDRLISILVNHNTIKPDDGKAFRAGFERSEHENFDDFLLKEGLVNRDDLLEALAIYFEVPAFDVVGYFFDHALLLQFPKDFLLRNEIIPLERDEQTLIVVAADPNNSNLLPEIGKFVSYDIQFRVGIAQDIIDAVEEFYDRSLTDLPNSDRVERQRQEAIRFLEHEKETTLEEEIERLDDMQDT